MKRGDDTYMKWHSPTSESELVAGPTKTGDCVSDASDRGALTTHGAGWQPRRDDAAFVTVQGIQPTSDPNWITAWSSTENLAFRSPTPPAVSGVTASGGSCAARFTPFVGSTVRVPSSCILVNAEQLSHRTRSVRDCWATTVSRMSSKVDAT